MKSTTIPPRKTPTYTIPHEVEPYLTEWRIMHPSNDNMRDKSVLKRLTPPLKE